MNRKELKEYVSAGKIGTVIDHLKNIIAQKNDNELADMVVSIQANYIQLIKQEIRNTESSENLQKFRAQITRSLCLVIDEMLSAEDFLLELPSNKEEIVTRDAHSFIDIHQRHDDVFDAPFYEKMVNYLNKAQQSIYITGGGLNNACPPDVMDQYLNPYRRLLDKSPDNRVYRLQYHDKLLYQTNGRWYKSLWTEKFTEFIGEYEGHHGLHIRVDEKLHYPLHCFVVDPYSSNAIVEFYLPAAKGNGGNAIFLFGNVNEKRDVAMGLKDSLERQMEQMRSIRSAADFSDYVDRLIVEKEGLYR
ncbi:MAG: hypothetical protein JNM22_11515 [Saprospiraceae bacterium]|nr:hypothetical protein [Saprospiraceae bacterium]